MELPAYGVNFLRDALSHRESLFCVARKNGKSAIVAVLALAYLVGPLRRGGLRLGTVSLTSPKAGELLRQMSEIAEASRLQGLQFYKSPAPGHIRTLDGTTAEFLSADRRSGHAAGFDVVLVDELGLMGERDRDLVAGMRTSTSARNGRFIALSIRGDSPLLEEMIERRDLPTCAVHLFAPDIPENGDVDVHDEAVWAQGNPGLAVGIKSRPVDAGRSGQDRSDTTGPGLVSRLRSEPQADTRPRNDLYRHGLSGLLCRRIAASIGGGMLGPRYW